MAEPNKSDKRLDVIWLAVQPTPYNRHLFQHLADVESIRFRVVYSAKQVANLRFDSTQTDDEFLGGFAGFDFGMVVRGLRKKALVVSVGWNHPTKLAILVLRRFLRRPYGFWTDSLKDGFRSNSLKNRLKRRFKKWLLGGATFVLTTGEFGVNQMKRTQIFDDDRRLFSLPFFVPIPKLAKEPLSISRDNVELLIMSRLIERKGIDIAIEAVSKLKQRGVRATLTIAGEGPLKDELSSLVTNHELSDQVQLIGWADSEQTVAIRNRAHFALHPVTELDPYPLVVLESLAFGLPVIGTNVAGTVVDRVQDGVNGFVIEPNDSDEIANAIERSVKNPDQYPAMVHAARQSALEWPGERAAEMFTNVLRSVQLIESID